MLVSQVLFYKGLIAFAELTRRRFGLSKRSKTHMDEIIGLTGDNDEDVKSDSSSLSFPNRRKWDFPKLARFGEHPLSPQLIWKSMERVNEPLANPWWALLMFFAISMLTPLVPEHQPPMDPATSSFYSFSPPAVVNGIPWWAFEIIIKSIIPFVILMVAIKNMPNTFTIDTDKIEKDGIDVDLVELTLRKKNRRTSYDERNTLLYRRRSTISKTMEDVKIADDLAKVQADEKVRESRQRMSALVMAKAFEGENLEEILEETI
jgi:hypothetical protein